MLNLKLSVKVSRAGRTVLTTYSGKFRIEYNRALAVHVKVVSVRLAIIDFLLRPSLTAFTIPSTKQLGYGL